MASYFYQSSQFERLSRKCNEYWGCALFFLSSLFELKIVRVHGLRITRFSQEIELIELEFDVGWQGQSVGWHKISVANTM